MVAQPLLFFLPLSFRVEFSSLTFFLQNYIKFAFPNREIICLNGAITVRLSWLVILEVIDSCKLTLTESSTSFDQVIWALSGMLT